MNTHSVAIKTDGTLWSWGHNSQGQLGDGTTVNKLSPIQIGTSANWSRVAAGDEFTMAIKTDGTLWGWGLNVNGALGDGTNLNKTVPTQIGTANNWSKISAGAWYTIAIKTDGTLWGWGLNDHISGILGLGDTVNRNVPTQIGTDANWAKVICGADHTIAIKNDGTAYAWGLNYNASTTLGTYQPSEGTYTPILLPTAMNGVCAVLENERFSLGTTFSISPNPAKEQVNIAFSTALQNPSISIVDITGKTVLTQNNTKLLDNTSINVADLSKGLYLVVVKSEGNTSVEKLVVD